MSKELFVAKSIELTSGTSLDLLLDKEMIPEENVKCWVRVRVDLDGSRTFSKDTEITYVVEDTMIPIDSMVSTVHKLIQSMIKAIDAIDRGINTLDSFYIEMPGIDSTTVEVRKSIRKTLENITMFELQSYIIDLYIVLVHYKGTDTLQRRKFEKMIELQQDAYNYNRFRGGMI